MDDERAKTTLYLRSMPVGVVREAKAAAAGRGCTLAAYVTGALELGLANQRASIPADPGHAEDELGEAMAWFERNREALLRKFRGEYVAIIDDEVADHDPDFETLATRVFERWGVRSVFMPRVEPGERRIKLRSPRRARA